MKSPAELDKSPHMVNIHFAPVEGMPDHPGRDVADPNFSVSEQRIMDISGSLRLSLTRITSPTSTDERSPTMPPWKTV